MNKCLNCNKETNNKKFCNRSCSAKYNNAKKGYKSPLKNCINCGKELGKNGWKSSKRKYCSNICQHEHNSKKYINAWLEGRESGSRKGDKQDLSRYIRKYLLKEANYKCSVCGWGEENPYSKSVPLEIDHIDGKSENNKRENLRVLCPNCHSLTPFYGILNRGNGRRIYRELWYKNK